VSRPWEGEGAVREGRARAAEGEAGEEPGLLIP